MSLLRPDADEDDGDEGDRGEEDEADVELGREDEVRGGAWRDWGVGFDHFGR